MITIGSDEVRQPGHIWLPEVGPACPWSRPERLLAPRAGFTFGLLSDRTGLARPGVFERAVEVLRRRAVHAAQYERPAARSVAVRR